MAGEYRTEAVLATLPPHLASAIRRGLRIARTNQPIIGMTIRSDMAEPLAAAYEAAGHKEWATGLRDGSLVPCERTAPAYDRYWQPGELFFRA